MDIFEAIRERHSYRGDFIQERVPRDDLRAIVDAGISAPSGCNAQSTSFVIVDEASVIQAIAEVVDKPVVNSAQAVIVCVIDKKPVFQNISFAVEDCAAAVENMLLVITALGYASVWIDGFLRKEDRASRLAEILKIPDNLEVRVLLPLGRPVEKGHQNDRLPFEERAYFNAWGESRENKSETEG